MSDSWYVYIIRCANNALYTGITTDIARRLHEHQSQSSKTAKALRGKAPLQLVLEIIVANKSSALQIEHKIKTLTKSEKEQFITAMQLICD